MFVVNSGSQDIYFSTINLGKFQSKHYISNHSILHLDSHYPQTDLYAVTFNNNDYDKRKSKLLEGRL